MKKVIKIVIVTPILILLLFVLLSFVFNKAYTSYYLSKITGTKSTAWTNLSDILYGRITLYDMKIDSPEGYSAKTAMTINYFSFKLDFKGIFKGKGFYLDRLDIKNTKMYYQLNFLDNNISQILNNVRKYIKEHFKEKFLIKKTVVKNMHIYIVEDGFKTDIFDIKLMHFKNYTNKTDNFSVIMNYLQKRAVKDIDHITYDVENSVVDAFDYVTGEDNNKQKEKKK